MSFGKIEFASAFSPLSAFPLDARDLMTKEEALAAAASAERAGSKNTTFYYGMRINVLEDVTLDDGTVEKEVVTYAITAANKLKKMSSTRYEEDMAALATAVSDASDAKTAVNTLRDDLLKKSEVTDGLFGLLKTVNNKSLISTTDDTNIDIEVPSVSDFLDKLVTINGTSLEKTESVVNLDLLTTGDLNGYAKTGDIEGTYLSKFDASNTYVAASGLEDTIKATIRSYLRTVNSNHLYKTDEASGDIVITAGSDIDNEALSNMLNNYLLAETFRAFKGDHETLDLAISSFITETDVNNILSDKDYLTQSSLSGYSNTEEMNLAIGKAISGIEKLTKKIVSYVDIDNCEVIKDGNITQAEENVIYLVPDPVMPGPDIYIEYTIIDGKLTCIGDTSTNLEDFYTKDEINSLLDEKAAYDHPHPELHTHNNKDSLDKIIINENGTDSSILTKKGYISKSDLFNGYATVIDANNAKSDAISDIKSYYTKDKIVEIIQEELNKYIQKIHLKTISSHKDGTLISLFNTSSSTPGNITFKTINGNSIIGDGDITIKAADGDGEAEVKSYVEVDTYTEDKRQLNEKIDKKVSNVVSDSNFIIVLDDNENTSVKRISFSIDCICAGNASFLTNDLNGTGSPDEPESV